MKALRGIAGTLLLLFSFTGAKVLIKHLGFPNEPYHGYKLFTDLLIVVVMTFSGVVLLLDARPGNGRKGPDDQ